MDPSRRLWPRADLRVGDADRQAVVTELQRHYVDGRLTSDELGERVDHALHARTFGDLAALLSDLPALNDAQPAQTHPAQSRDDWSPSQSGWTFTPSSVGVILMIVGVIALVAVFAIPGMRIGFFPWPLLIWGFFFFGRPFGRRRF